MSLGVSCTGERAISDHARAATSPRQPPRPRQLIAKADETLTPEAR